MPCLVVCGVLREHVVVAAAEVVLLAVAVGVATLLRSVLELELVLLALVRVFCSKLQGRWACGL